MGHGEGGDKAFDTGVVQHSFGDGDGMVPVPVARRVVMGSARVATFGTAQLPYYPYKVK